MRIALLIAEPPTSPNPELRRHAHRLEEQFRATGIDCVVLNQARQALLVGRGGGSSETPPRLDVATGIGEALVEARPDVLHVLHALDGTGVLIGGPIPYPVVMHLHPPGTFSVAEGLATSLRAAATGSPNGSNGTSPAASLHELRPDGGFLSLADAVISPSSALLGELIGAGAEQALREIPLGVDYARPAARAPSGAGEGLHIAVAGGRTEDLEVLRGPTVQISSLDGAPERDIESGPRGSEAGIDVLFLPGLSFGKCSYAALEAAAAGTLVVGPDRPGVRELIRDHRCGLTFDPAKPGTAAQLLRRLADDPGLVRRARSEIRYPPGVEDEAFLISQMHRELLSRPRNGRGTRAKAAAGCRLLSSGVDHPTPGETVPRSVLRLVGWALCDPSPLCRVEVAMNGQPVGPARIGLERPDVAGLFPAPEATVCGFELLVDLSTLPAALTSATFDIAVRAADGSSFVLPQLEIEIAEPGNDYLEAVRRSAELRIARGRSAGRPRVRPGEVRLAVFTHDLQYGGAQLYLWEMLRLLAPEPWFSCTVVSPCDGPLAGDLRAAGIEVHLTAVPHWGADEYESGLKGLAAWVRAEGFNVIFANTLLAFAGVDLASRLGLPSAWAIHESYSPSVFWSVAYPSAPIHPYVAARGEAALGAASNLVFEADATRRMFERYTTPDRLVLQPYGVDIAAIDAYRSGFDKRRARERWGIPVSATVLLCLGTITSRKSQTLLAQAFNAVAASHPDAFCVFVGALKDDYAAALREYLERAGLAGRSLVIPVVPDTYEWYGLADLFASASDIESLPRSVLEAMAFDLPVAATAVYGLPELLEDGHTGHLCEAGDVTALAELLDRHLSMIPAQREAMAGAAARLVREQHDSSGYARDYAGLFRRLVADAPSPAAPAAATLPLDDDAEGMSREISPYESMLDSTPEVYFSVSLSARRSIRLATALAGGLHPRSILDFACGHGRVMRVLRHDFPDAEITACDVDKVGVDFCAATFGARSVYGSTRPEEIDLGGPFDLIWCGSLLTHLDEQQWHVLLKQWSENLAQGGVVVFTTHGRLVANRLPRFSYGLDSPSVHRVLEGYEASGFGYADYPDQPGYGISLSTPSRVLALLESLVPDLRVLMYEEAAWDRHQDVVACVRDAEARIHKAP